MAVHLVISWQETGFDTVKIYFRQSGSKRQVLIECSQGASQNILSCEPLQ